MSIDIFSLLQTYPHNYHYLKRYYNFILSCVKANSSKPKEELGYTEKHHILPKSMFPEYKSFSKFPSNNAVLSCRQHLIAHVLLWKAFPKEAKMLYAAHSMLYTQRKNMGVPLAIQLRYLEKLIKEFRDSRVGIGNPMYGKKHSDLTKVKMSDIKKGIEFTSEHRKNISLANTGRASNNINGMRGKTHSESTKMKMSSTRKNKATYIDANGIRYYLRIGDPLITSLSLTGLTKNKKIKAPANIKERCSKISSDYWKSAKVMTCPYCGKSSRQNMKRYHFDKCKNKFI